MRKAAEIEIVRSGSVRISTSVASLQGTHEEEESVQRNEGAG